MGTCVLYRAHHCLAPCDDDSSGGHRASHMPISPLQVALRIQSERQRGPDHGAGVLSCHAGLPPNELPSPAPTAPSPGRDGTFPVPGRASAPGLPSTQRNGSQKTDPQSGLLPEIKARHHLHEINKSKYHQQISVCHLLPCQLNWQRPPENSKETLAKAPPPA